MLVLTRKFGESIIIGDDIKITILDSKGKNIRIGIEAPRNIVIQRKDIDIGQRVEGKNQEPDGQDAKGEKK